MLERGDVVYYHCYEDVDNLAIVVSGPEAAGANNVGIDWIIQPSRRSTWSYKYQDDGSIAEYHMNSDIWLEESSLTKIGHIELPADTGGAGGEAP